jgi:hypothetical protein
MEKDKILGKTVKRFGDSSCHIILPSKWLNKKCFIMDEDPYNKILTLMGIYKDQLDKIQSSSLAIDLIYNEFKKARDEISDIN